MIEHERTDGGCGLHHVGIREGGSGAGGSVPTTSGTTSTSEKPVAPAAPVEPYADIDFAENSVTEKNGVISLEIKTNGEASAAAVKDVTLTFGGSTKTLSALRIENAGTWVKGVFDEFEDGAAFDIRCGALSRDCVNRFIMHTKKYGISFAKHCLRAIPVNRYGRAAG